MEIVEIERAVEAILFATGDPVELSRIAEILDVDEPSLERIITNLRDYYDFEQRGVRIVKLDNSYQMCSAPQYAEYIRKALETKKAPRLSPPLLEVLSVIAYRQPVTRAYVEQVRGVDCSYSITSLTEKGLIRESGRLDVPGKPILYRTTKDFLRVFGLESLNDLPELPEFSDTEDGQMTFSEAEHEAEHQPEQNEG
ncbi:MAG: SMC-Scp complex subunit ScpB [Oscillospiraceae bacterium]|nr:SMC-Scp complex subunit ScpB [Oscillospiraceae bacterium]